MTTPKIATCCYCGTRAALVLGGRTRHELSCASCGAPLRDLKMLKAEHPGQRELVKPSRVRTPRKPATTKNERRRKPKRRKSFRRKLLEEAWDFVEDIFD